MAVPVQHPRLGPLSLLGSPLTMAGATARIDAPAPDKGEHNREVLAEFGFTAAEIAALETQHTPT